MVNCLQAIRREFKWKNLGFSGIRVERFCTSQWRMPPVVYLAHRVAITVYVFYWLGRFSFLREGFSSQGADGNPWGAFLTNWTYTLLTIYVSWHLIAVVIFYTLAIVWPRQSSAGLLCWGRPSEEFHKGLFAETDGSRYGGRYEQITGHNFENTSNDSDFSTVKKNRQRNPHRAADVARDSDDPENLTNSSNVGRFDVFTNSAQSPGNSGSPSSNSAKNLRKSGSLSTSSAESRGISGSLSLDGDPDIQRNCACSFCGVSVLRTHPSWYMCLVWILYCAVSTGAVLVTGVYFTLLYPSSDQYPKIGQEDLQLHLLNSCVVLLEHAVSAVPYRLLHIVYPFLYGFIYMLFSVIHWNADNSNVIYPFLDWNKPGPTIGFVLLTACLLIPVLHCFFFLIYKAKIAIYRRF